MSNSFLNLALYSGVSGKCPHAVPKPNSTTCNSGANTCYNGLCVGSICSNYGRHSCECTDVEELCHVCCASGNEVFFTYCIREINNDVRDFSVLQHFQKTMLFVIRKKTLLAHQTRYGINAYFSYENDQKRINFIEVLSNVVSHEHCKQEHCESIKPLLGKVLCNPSLSQLALLLKTLSLVSGEVLVHKPPRG